MEEEQICAFLNGHGIPARIARPGFREGYAIKLRGGRIPVPQEYAMKARDLLARARRGELQIQADDAE